MRSTLGQIAAENSAFVIREGLYTVPSHCAATQLSAAIHPIPSGSCAVFDELSSIALTWNVLQSACSGVYCTSPSAAASSRYNTSHTATGVAATSLRRPLWRPRLRSMSVHSRVPCYQLGCGTRQDVVASKTPSKSRTAANIGRTVRCTRRRTAPGNKDWSSFSFAPAGQDWQQ